ncbi:hypothetical protein C8R45DRAFT_922701 [Mycena sanguinolenta]|nr:hypothetical protein C8R45DRAFT_922701 [Mycena sanguinolenta]
MDVRESRLCKSAAALVWEQHLMREMNSVRNLYLRCGHPDNLPPIEVYLLPLVSFPSEDRKRNTNHDFSLQPPVSRAVQINSIVNASPTCTTISNSSVSHSESACKDTDGLRRFQLQPNDVLNPNGTVSIPDHRDESASAGSDWKSPFGYLGQIISAVYDVVEFRATALETIYRLKLGPEYLKQEYTVIVGIQHPERPSSVQGEFGSEPRKKMIASDAEAICQDMPALRAISPSRAEVTYQTTDRQRTALLDSGVQRRSNGFQGKPVAHFESSAVHWILSRDYSAGFHRPMPKFDLPTLCEFSRESGVGGVVSIDRPVDLSLNCRHARDSFFGIFGTFKSAISYYWNFKHIFIPTTDVEGIFFGLRYHCLHQKLMTSLRQNLAYKYTKKGISRVSAIQTQIDQPVYRHNSPT